MDIQLNDNIIHFNKFKFPDLYRTYNILIIGGPASGKTKLIQNLLSQMPKSMYDTVISPINNHYDYFVPSNNIYNRFNSNIVNELLAKRNAASFKNMCFVMDTCINSVDVKNNNSLVQKLLLESRHHKINFINSTQCPRDIPVTFLPYYDYIFILKTSEKKQVYFNHANVIPSYNIFESIYDKMTRDFGCMVINNINTKNIDNKILWYKPEFNRELHYENDSLFTNDLTSIDDYKISIPDNMIKKKKIKIQVDNCEITIKFT